MIAAAAALLGRQLQAPGQAQRPPVGLPRNGPVMPLIEATHGRCEGIGQGIGIVAKQLGQPLVGKAIGAEPSVAARQMAGPTHRLGPIARLLGKACKASLGVTAAPHVLHHDQKAMAGIPSRVGIGDRGCDRPPVGLPHQQHRPGPLACWLPNPGH